MFHPHLTLHYWEEKKEITSEKKYFWGLYKEKKKRKEDQSKIEFLLYNFQNFPLEYF